MHNKMRLISLLALAFAATGAMAQQGNYYAPPPGSAGADGAHYAWADVLRVDPVYGMARTTAPSTQCYDQQVVQQTPSNKGVGTVLGAVVGGVLGSTIGHGRGNTAAIVGGAVAGGAVGHSVASGGQTYTSNQTICQPVTQVSEQRQIIGYDVEYRYHGDVYMSRLAYDPGERVRVRVSVSPAD